MRRPDRLLAALAGALAAVTLARLPAAWESGNALNHVSGAWMALADDLARGTLYRPLHDPALGFGGTRFFPLAFALHAGLVRLGAPLLPAGLALSLGAGALLAVAAWALLRRLGLARVPAAAFAVLAAAGFAGQHALAAVRGDLLAVALEAAGLALVAGAPGPRRLAGAAGALVLAFAAKPTALTAAAAAATYLAVLGRRRAALALAAAVAAGSAAVVLATDALSSGRFLAILVACAAGGAGAGDLARSPLRLAHLFAVEDRGGAVLVAAALVALVLSARRMLRPAGGPRLDPGDPRLLPALWVGAALAGALAIFASPGTGVNHLLELEAASAVLLGACATTPGLAGAAARAGAPVAALAGVLVALSTWTTDRAVSRLAEIRGVLASAPAPLVSEDPLVPLLAGATPLVQDPWMLRLVSERDEGMARPLLEALRARRPAAVILFRDLADPGADAWYARGDLGPAVVAEVRRGYRLARRVGRYFVYVPADPARAPAAPRLAEASGAAAPEARAAVARSAAKAMAVPNAHPVPDRRPATPPAPAAPPARSPATPRATTTRVVVRPAL
ncbi:hypothetical protein [Anaeromyxobacter oryzae]|uniref:Glycosyltransferase RgtA/B/C/D-like domain-containing protein n=1 Tax=Anaeromyxobacter oryzae TaxID=2918170 RepID=A0ABN6MSI0_9BACT|nr:hypothetical protein [Anaeromyxobacter oryzae]BDG03911.1 hypothetical protein AMOR_29070 [Anaeromyxobacter oryzae]